MHSHVAPFQRRTVSFVRRENRVGPEAQRVWDEHNHGLVLDVPRTQGFMSVAPGHELDAARDFGRVAPLVVEIGSGTGDAVVQGALARPGTNFLAVEVYGTVFQQYKEGLVSLNDVLTAQTAVSEAEGGLNREIFNYKLAELRFLKSVGRLRELLK